MGGKNSKTILLIVLQVGIPISSSEVMKKL